MLIAGMFGHVLWPELEIRGSKGRKWMLFVQNVQGWRPDVEIMVKLGENCGDAMEFRT